MMERFGKIERETETIGRKKSGRRKRRRERASSGGLVVARPIRRGGETGVMGNLVAVPKSRLTAKIDRVAEVKQ